MAHLKVFDLSAPSTTGFTLTTTPIDMENQMRKTTTGKIRKAGRKETGRQSAVNARMAAQASRQYDFRRGGHRR